MNKGKPLAAYIVEFSIDYRVFICDKRVRTVVANSDMDAENKLINLMLKRLKKTHPEQIFHRGDIDVWKTIKTIEIDEEDYLQRKKECESEVKENEQSILERYPWLQ